MNFRSEYDEHDAFYARGDLLRPGFGNWDAFDPVAREILNVVEAQTELADLFDADQYTLVSETAFRAAVEKRHAAINRLLRAAEDRASWPDPEMGARD